jgi:hypothetical protein
MSRERKNLFIPVNKPSGLYVSFLVFPFAEPECFVQQRGRCFDSGTKLTF